MSTRRRFLQASAVTAGAVVTSQLDLKANAESKSANMPPSIASLVSMKDQAVPISRDERRERQEQARQLMGTNHLDAIVLMEGTSLTYFNGMRW